MVRCKAGEILRSEAHFMYAAATKGEAERLEMAVYRLPLFGGLVTVKEGGHGFGEGVVPVTGNHMPCP